MRYSISNYSVMCVYCVFGKQEKVSQQKGSFVSTEGVSDWSNIGRLVKLHICECPPPPHMTLLLRVIILYTFQAEIKKIFAVFSPHK